MTKQSQGLRLTFRAIANHPPPISTERRRVWVHLWFPMRPAGERRQLGVWLGDNTYRLLGGDRRQLSLGDPTHWAPLIELPNNNEEMPDDRTLREPDAQRAHGQG